jgi:hypothetical protein
MASDTVYIFEYCKNLRQGDRLHAIENLQTTWSKKLRRTFEETFG